MRLVLRYFDFLQCERVDACPSFGRARVGDAYPNHSVVSCERGARGRLHGAFVLLASVIVACAVILAGTALVRIKIQSSHQSEYCRNGSLGGRSGRSGVDPRVLAQPRFTHLLNVSPSVVILSVGAFFLLGWAALYGRIHGMKWFRWILLLIAVPLTFIGIRLAIRDPLCCHFVASSVRGCGRCAADAVTCRLDHWTPAMFRLDHSTRTN